MEENKLKVKVRDVRNGDWLWINKLVLDHPYLTSSAKVVYSALAYFTNDNQKSYPSFEKIANLTHLKRITVIKAVKQLKEYHFIEIVKNPGKTNYYILLKLTDSKPVKKIYPSKKRGWFIPGTGVV